MEDIQKFIQECLPSISTDNLSLIMETFTTLGVESFEDLQHIEPEKDLINVLKLIQARKLKKSIAAAFNQEKMLIQPQIVEIVQQSPVLETPVVEFIQKTNLDSDSLLEKIPFHRFPKVLLIKLEKGERPSPAERREAVRIIAAAVMEHIPTPRKKHVEAVAMEVVRQYPDSFKDTIGKDSVGLGYGSLLCQLIARVENCRRTSGAVKRKVSTSLGKNAPKRLSDSYGCINYQPCDFPDGENEATQKEKQLFMKNEYKKIVRDYDKIKMYMMDTYASQRITINCKSSIKNIKTEWPFLTERKFLYEHTENLTGICLRNKFESAIKEKITELLNYTRSIDKNKELDLNPPHLYLLKILTTLFKENLALLMEIYEEDKNLIEVSEEAPVTPFIACIGNPFDLAPVCTVFVEKEPFEVNIPLDDAFLMWFSCFYAFNLRYPEECCATLEFIQRALFGINPESKGTKMEKRFGKRVLIHPKVLKLLNDIKNFSSQWNI